MKYLKKFSIESDYQVFKTSADYIEPNVSVIEEDNKCCYNPIKPLFPCYLIVGDNGDNGVALYQYLTNTYPNSGTVTLGESEIIYLNSERVYKITKYNNLYVMGEMATIDYELSSTGLVYEPNHSGGGN